MTGLLIFIEIALAGCAFLLYFLYKLWQDSRKSRSGTRVEIRGISARPARTGRLLRFYSTEQSATNKRSQRASRL